MAYAFKKAAAQIKRARLDPETVGSELERIAKQRGSLTPRAVVEEARASSHPLHGYFEWDDSEAAERWRESQAAYLIRNITVIHEDREEIRAFIHVEPEAGEDAGPEPAAGEYRHVEVVMADAVLRAQVLNRALDALESWQRAYRNLDELREVIDAADRALAAAGRSAAA